METTNIYSLPFSHLNLKIELGVPKGPFCEHSLERSHANRRERCFYLDWQKIVLTQINNGGRLGSIELFSQLGRHRSDEDG